MPKSTTYHELLDKQKGVRGSLGSLDPVGLSQYTSLAFGQRLEQAGILGSMGNIGDALDNAVAESFFATLQVELLDRQRWSTRRELTTAIFDYTEVFFNRQRLHSTLGYLSPTEFEEVYALQQAA